MLITAGFQIPVIPFNDVTGKLGAVDPWQRGPITENEGSTGASTIMFKGELVAHCPAVGVNVYVVVPGVVVLTKAFQLPVIPLSETEGNTGAVDPSQNGPTGANDGITGAITVMSKGKLLAHNPAVGVKV